MDASQRLTGLRKDMREKEFNLKELVGKEKVSSTRSNKRKEGRQEASATVSQADAMQATELTECRRFYIHNVTSSITTTTVTGYRITHVCI